ncbi:glycosyltransferase BC10 [Magnolia sinica]|uniref:glycosyltransferase BC10 n=1 Tax=Magnolia sinica TaxID=86752 RepID=UPI0026580C46|nr:glycosyltransferase BC10 [Magnolia sinica]XP_058105697.1 glycosyltransferase BC10 [Magnolia sinica]
MIEIDRTRSAMFSTPFVLSFALLLSLPLLFLLAPRILPPRNIPISLPDELDDLALFRRAALASLSPPPPPPTPKIAFLFLTNSDLSFAPLWERFFAGHDPLFNIYIHADPTSRLHPPSSGVFHNRFIPGKRTQRASPTLISAARRLLAAALLDDPANTYFALLSQHCIPLHSFRFVYHSLFSDYPPANYSSPSNSTPYRYHYHLRSFIEILAEEPNLWDRYTARGNDIMMPEVPFSDFRVGSQFFILTRRHALLVIQDRRLWRKFRLPCHKAESCYPEEHYFPTLLSMEDPKGCTHYTLTRVNWTGSTGGHPHTYGPAEVSGELVERLRKSNSTYSYLFARKFAAACLKPLMKIADSVIFRD